MNQETITFEHKFLFYLSFTLLLSNNPFFVFIKNFYLENMIWNVFQTFQYILTLIFIISICNRIMTEPLEVDSFALNKKLIYLGVAMLLSSLTFFICFITKTDVSNPILKYVLMNKWLKFCVLIFWIVIHIKIFGIIFQKLFYLIRKWDFVLQRHQFVIILSLAFFFCYCISFVFLAFQTQVILQNIYLIIL